MAKFILVEEAPANLNDGEIVINMPDFVEEIEQSKRFASKLGGGRTVTQLFHLKNIVNNISQAYDPEGLDPITAVPYSKYEGIEFKDSKDLSEKVIVKMLNKHCPDIVNKYLDKKIKTRPEGTKTVYFVGPESHIKVFLENGLDHGGLKKKVVETE